MIFKPILSYKLPKKSRIVVSFYVVQNTKLRLRDLPKFTAFTNDGQSKDQNLCLDLCPKVLFKYIYVCVNLAYEVLF